MVEKRQGGHKVCRHAADILRKETAFSLKENGKLLPEEVKKFRRFASDDARLHSKIDPHYETGDGPAVKNRNE